MWRLICIPRGYHSFYHVDAEVVGGFEDCCIQGTVVGIFQMLIVCELFVATLQDILHTQPSRNICQFQISRTI